MTIEMYLVMKKRTLDRPFQFLASYNFLFSHIMYIYFYGVIILANNKMLIYYYSIS